MYVPPEPYLSASSASRSQSIYWMGLGGGGSIYCFKYIPLEDFFPFVFPSYFSVDCWIQFCWILRLVPSLDLFVHLPLFFFSDSILAPPHEIVGGCWDRDADTLSNLGSLFSLPLIPCVVRIGDRSLTICTLTA